MKAQHLLPSTRSGRIHSFASSFVLVLHASLGMLSTERHGSPVVPDGHDGGEFLCLEKGLELGATS